MKPASAKKGFVGLTAIWFILLVIAGTVTFLPYPLAKILADKVSMAGSSTRFTPGLFSDIQGQARWITLVLVLIGPVLFFFRKKIVKLLREQIPSASDYRRLIEIPVLSGREVFALLLLTILGCALRLNYMQGIVTYDEAFNFFQYAQNPLTAVTVYTHVNNHIFHTFLLSIITSLLGDSYWVLRLIPLISGTLLIPLVFLLVRSLPSSRKAVSGWLAAAIISVSPMLVMYSALGRGYALQLFLGLLVWFVFIQIYEGRESLSFLLGVLCSLALWTIPTSSYLVIGLGLAFMGGIIQGRMKIHDFIFFLMITVIMSGILWSPALIISGVKAVFLNQEINPIASGLVFSTFFQRFTYVQEVLSLSIGWPEGFVTVMLPVLWGLYAAPGVWRCLGWGISAAVLILTVLLPVTPFARTWIFLVPLWAILIDFAVIDLLGRFNIKGIRPYLFVSVPAMIYLLLVSPKLIKPESPGHKEITAFARAVAAQWPAGQAVRIEVDKTGDLQPDSDEFYTHYDWFNAYTVRYYLLRQGIPESAFRWKREASSPTVWLISVKVDGKQVDRQGPEGKRYRWALVMGPYALAKNVARNEIRD